MSLPLSGQTAAITGAYVALVDAIEWAKKNGEELMLRSFAKFANELLGRNRPIRLEHSVDSNYILQLQDNRRVSVWPLETVAAGTVDSSGAVKI